MKKINKLILFIVSFLIIISTFITVIDLVSFDRNFYDLQYEKLNVYNTIGISSKELDIVTDKLLGYIKDDYKDIKVIANINGVNREVFNERETLHMVDVKNLYLDAINIRNLSILLSASFLILYFILNKKIDFYDFFKSFKSSFLFILFSILGISVYAYTDFYDFWMNFHYLFFTNDLFILNPNTDILIMMVPQQFFMNLVFKIIFYFIISISLIFIILYLLGRKTNDKYRVI